MNGTCRNILPRVLYAHAHRWLSILWVFTVGLQRKRLVNIVKILNYGKNGKFIYARPNIYAVPINVVSADSQFNTESINIKNLYFGDGGREKLAPRLFA